MEANFCLTFKIQFETKFGESLHIVGSCPELGSWKAYRCPLKWNEGHVWTSDPLVIRSCSYFMYKYVIMNSQSGKAAKWEKGPNRIADLDILPDKNKLALMNSGMNQDSIEASPDSRHSQKPHSVLS